jgi:hypothetical protein
MISSTSLCLSFRLSREFESVWLTLNWITIPGEQRSAAWIPSLPNLNSDSARSTRLAFSSVPPNQEIEIRGVTRESVVGDCESANHQVFNSVRVEQFEKLAPVFVQRHRDVGGREGPSEYSGAPRRTSPRRSARRPYRRPRRWRISEPFSSLGLWAAAFSAITEVRTPCGASDYFHACVMPPDPAAIGSLRGQEGTAARGSPTRNP